MCVCVCVIFLLCSVPSQWLATYNSVCCCTAKGSLSSTKVVPVCFPETLFFKQMVLLVTSSSFPVSPLGLIHVKQVIRAFEPLVQLLEEPVDLRTEVSRLEMVPKGIEIDFTCRVFLRGRDICIWEGVTTLLSRNAGTVKRQTRARPTKPPEPSCAARDTGVQCWIPSSCSGAVAVTYLKFSSISRCCQFGSKYNSQLQYNYIIN